MDTVEIDSLGSPSVDEPVFIEGLPGVGLVGKLAVDHLIAELDGQPVRRIYSTHFPPAISVNDDGRAELASLTVHAVDAGSRCIESAGAALDPSVTFRCVLPTAKAASNR